MTRVRNCTRGYYAYAMLMRSVQQGDISTASLAAKHKLSHNPVGQILWRLHHMKVVHIGGWERERRQGCGFHEVWSFGAGRDADRPLTEKGAQAISKRTTRLPFRPQIFLFGQLMLALEDGNTLDALADIVGMECKQLRDLLTFMKNNHLVHIPDWHRNPAGCPSPVFKLGDKRSASKPKPRGREVRDIEYEGECSRREQWRSLLHLTAAPLQPTAFG